MCLQRYCRARISSTCSLARPRSYSRGTIAPFPSRVSSSQSGGQRFHSIWTLKCQPPLCNPRNPRLADNCRPLISVADTFGPQDGEAARSALIELCASLPHSDSGVQALQDIRTVSFDRISKKALVEALHETGHWDAWRGPNDQGKPHPLTTGELSRLLRRFGIRARTHWPIPRLPGSKSSSGYRRADFEQAWADHCPENDTSTHPSKIIALAKP